MAGDIDPRAIKPIDGSFSFDGGMDLVSPPDALSGNEARILKNVDVRRFAAEKAKGQRSFTDVEIGAFYYDRFSAVDIDVAKWDATVTGDGSVAINSDGELVVTGTTSGNAWAENGITGQRVTFTDELSYIEMLVTTPSTQTSTDRFRISLSPTSSALDTDSGLQIEFDESGDIIRREGASETDTTVDWVVDNTYLIRIEKQATGFKGTLLDITAGSQTATALFTTTFEGVSPSYLEFQAYGGAWKVDDVVYHAGFGDAGARIAPTGVTRFYRETAANETIVVAHGKMYKYLYTEGFTELTTGLDTEAKNRFAIFEDELFMVNGVDDPIRYDGSNVNNVGSGTTAAPKADYIISHLQSLFMFKGNAIFRNVVGNTNSWTPLASLIDIDAWQGDVITGALKLGGNLFIIKSSSVWELAGTTNENFILRRILGSRGCVAPNSLATNGQVAFWRGSNGVYRFDGRQTQLVSYAIHPCFEPNSRAEFSTTVFGNAADSVGVIHDFKYRLAVIQHGEEDITFNNFEYVFDLIANSGKGAWLQRDQRNVSMYAALDGEGDTGELLYVPSDTTNNLFQAEIEDGNSYNDYSSVTIKRKTDVDFIGEIWTSRYVARRTARFYLDKQWGDFTVHYNPVGNHPLGVRVYSTEGPAGQLHAFPMTRGLNAQDLGGSNFPLDGTATLSDGFVTEKFKRVMTSAGGENLGMEVWAHITQDAASRTEASYTGTGIQTNPGNFEPFRVKGLIFSFNEENH